MWNKNISSVDSLTFYFKFFLCFITVIFLLVMSWNFQFLGNLEMPGNVKFIPFFEYRTRLFYTYLFPDRYLIKNNYSSVKIFFLFTLSFLLIMRKM